MSETDNFPEDKQAAQLPGETLPLLNYLDELDPEHQLGDPAARASLLIDADPFAAAMALREVHQRIGEHTEEISDRLITLRSNDAINHTGVAPEDRAEVFSYALDTAKQAASRGNLELAGRILGGSITALQAFTDGNKRAARAVYMLTAHGYDGSEEDRQLLSQTVAPQEFDYTKVPIFLPYANWNIQAFLAREGGDDSQWIDRMRELEIKWAAEKPTYDVFIDLIRRALPDCQQPHKLTSIIQDEGLGPYILTNHAGVDISALGGKDGINSEALEELVRSLDKDDIEQLFEESEVLKAEYITFLIDRTIEAAEAGDSIKGTPADHINITGKPLLDAAFTS